MFCIGDRIAEDVLKEGLQDATRLFVDEAADPLHATTASQTTDGRFGYALDVVAEHLPLPHRTSLSHDGLLLGLEAELVSFRTLRPGDVVQTGHFECHTMDSM